MANIVFMNRDKESRARIIYTFVSGKKIPRTEGDVYLKERHSELLTLAKVKLDDEEKCVQFIYKKLGGLTLTSDQIEKKKRVYANKKKMQSAEDMESSGVPVDDDEDVEEDDDE